MGFAVPVPYPPAPTIAVSEEQAEHPALFRLGQAQLFFSSSIEGRGGAFLGVSLTSAAGAAAVDDSSCANAGAAQSRSMISFISGSPRLGNRR